MTVTVANGPVPGQSRTSAAASPSFRDLFIVASYHWRMIFVVMLLAIVAGAAAMVLSPVLYTARSQVLVLPREPGIAGALGGALLPFDSARATQAEAELIRDRGIVRGMVEKIGPEVLYPEIARPRFFGLLPAYPPNQRQEITIDVVLRALTVAAETTSNLLTVSYDHTSREVALLAVDTLLEVYLERRAEIYRTARTPVLRARAESYLAQLRGVEAEIRARKAEFNIISLDQDVLLALRIYDSVLQRRLVQIERREAALAQVTSTERRLRELPGSVFDYTERTDRVENDETDNVLAKLRVERDTLRMRYQESEPRIEELNRQIQVMEDIKRQPRRDSSTKREVRNPTLDVMTNNLYQRRVEADAAIRSVVELDRQVEESRARIDQLRIAEGAFQNLERSRVLFEQLYKEASQRAEAANFEESSADSRGATIRVVDRADASVRGRSNGPSIAAACVIGGMMLAGVLTMLVSWNRQTFLMPEEVTRKLGLPVLASFTDDNGFTSQEGQAQIVFLAAQIAPTRSKAPGGAVIQVVSSTKVERRSAVAAALACELAEGQNKRVVILDLTGDGDRQWKRFKGKEPVPLGDSDVLAAQTEVPRLQVTYRATRGPINWLRIDARTLNSTLTRLRADYEMIIVDAPSTRESLVALRLAKAVEGSIMVIRAEHTRAPSAARLRDQLLEAGGDIFGAVVTGRRFSVPRMIYRWL